MAGDASARAGASEPRTPSRSAHVGRRSLQPPPHLLGRPPVWPGDRPLPWGHADVLACSITGHAAASTRVCACRGSGRQGVTFGRSATWTARGIGAFRAWAGQGGKQAAGVRHGDAEVGARGCPAGCCGGICRGWRRRNRHCEWPSTIRRAQGHRTRGCGGDPLSLQYALCWIARCVGEGKLYVRSRGVAA
jgi:hypothetical protein